MLSGRYVGFIITIVIVVAGFLGAISLYNPTSSAPANTCVGYDPQDICRNVILNSNGLLTAQIGYGPGIKMQFLGYICQKFSVENAGYQPTNLPYLPMNLTYDSVNSINVINMTFRCWTNTTVTNSSFSGILWAKYLYIYPYSTSYPNYLQLAKFTAKITP